MTIINTDEAAANVSSLEASATASAAAIDQAFAKAGASLSSSLAKAAADGKLSLAGLAQAVISAADSAAGTSGTGLGGVLSSLLSSATSAFAGARADGGPVQPGGSYLVGERGPEVFTPASSGMVGPGTGPAVNVTLNVTGDAKTLVRSQAQIATAISRAATLGGR